MTNNNFKNIIKIKLLRGSYNFLRFVIIFGIGFIILKPILCKILLSFMAPSDLLDNTVRLFSKDPSLYYWKAGLKQIFLPNSFINTVILSLSIALIQTCFSTVVGYGLARFKFKGSGIAFAFVIAMLLVPFQAISIAQYQSFVNLKIGTFEIVDTFIPLYILAATGLAIKEGLYVYLMRENFKSLSDTLEEAAYIDGAGVFRTFASIMVPNARTMMITVFLFSFCWQWTDKTYSGLYLRDTKVLANLIGAVTIKNDLHIDTVGTEISRCAVSLFVAIPLIALFVLCQKFFVKSISQTGLSSS